MPDHMGLGDSCLMLGALQHGPRKTVRDGGGVVVAVGCGSEWGWWRSVSVVVVVVTGGERWWVAAGPGDVG
jgi:hypothetical protein